MFFKSQRGAMFSLDARIAVIIGSILAGVISVQSISRVERTRIATAEQQLEELSLGLAAYMEDASTTGVPSTIAALVTSGHVKSGVTDSDPWGNTWQYHAVSENKTIDGITFPVYYAALYSYGPDGLNNSGTAPTTVALQKSFAPGGDDLAVRYNSFDLERKRVDTFKAMGQEVIASLAAFEAARFSDNQTYCSGLVDSNADAVITFGAGATHDYAANSAQQYRCDTNYDGTYDQNEEDGLNYFPPSVSDNTRASAAAGGNIYFDKRLSGAATIYSTSVSDMQSLLTLLGLPTSYATDPWGQTMVYNSNLFDASFSPFKANVKWQ